MNKKILLIGNNHGRPGVQKDFINYTSFFKDEIGGNWYDSEIAQKMNPSKDVLKKTLDQLRKESLEFLILIFSGLANQKREFTVEVNKAGGHIAESDLRDIAHKQITIYDCCQSTPKSIERKTSKKTSPKSSTSESEIRTLYEKRIEQSIPQQACLYACSVGQIAHDTAEGGEYSNYLLGVARAIQTDYISISVAHQLASLLTTNHYKDQVPDQFITKCSPSEELILSINPHLKKTHK
jgi:hypothetical protein